MPQPNEQLRQELLTMRETDLSVRAELLVDGSLGDGYHPRMEAVHRQNTARLVAIIDRHGWPGRNLVGDDGAEAAWLIAQHAIGDPPFQRQSLLLLKEAAERGDVPLWQPAMLEDRIRMFEGQPQIYGTQFEPDEEGELVPYPIENPSRVDERRQSVGLDSLQDNLERMRAQSTQEGKQIPPDRAIWQQQYQEWLRSVGWRK